MKKIFQSYKTLPTDVWWLLGADVALQLINAAFALLLNYVMIDHGYKDYDITSINGNRYLAVLICAYPLTLISERINLKNLLLIGSVTAPLLSLATLWCIHFHLSELLRLVTFLWGVSFSLVQIMALPILMNITTEENETEAISLFFAIGSFTTIICGLFNYLANLVFPDFSNISLLALYCFVACFGPFFIYKLNDIHPKSKAEQVYRTTKSDWRKIGEVLIPVFLIAFGAGFTIPFINLFFKFVHNVEAPVFSLINTIAFVLVVLGGFINPIIKRKLGYKFAITFFQSLAIIALFLLGTTEWIQGYAYAPLIAMGLFIVRQPLMNIAGPLTTELSMKYVGEQNRKLVSAIISAIWSGSWFISAVLFSILREMKIAYSNIIFITVGFYILGVVWYYLLILKFEKSTSTS